MLPLSVPAALTDPASVSDGTGFGTLATSRGGGAPLIIRAISVARSARAESPLARASARAATPGLGATGIFDVALCGMNRLNAPRESMATAYVSVPARV